MNRLADPLDIDRLFHQFDQAFARMFEKQTFRTFRARDTWAPHLNAYRLPTALEIHVDLAGVEKQAVQLAIEPGCMRLSGYRAAPAPARSEGAGVGVGVQVLAMEIEHGPFERTITLPAEADLAGVEVAQREGILVIRIPLRMSCGQ